VPTLTVVNPPRRVRLVRVVNVVQSFPVRIHHSKGEITHPSHLVEAVEDLEQTVVVENCLVRELT
jgi:hypothetical protein